MDRMTTNYYFGMYKDVAAHHRVLEKAKMFSFSGKLNFIKIIFKKVNVTILIEP